MEGIRVGGSVPVYREFLLVVRLDWAILRETLNNFNGAVELSVDKLVRVHGLDEGQRGVREVGREIGGNGETPFLSVDVDVGEWVFGKMIGNRG